MILFLYFFLSRLPPPRSTLTYTRVPYTTLFRSSIRGTEAGTVERAGVFGSATPAAAQGTVVAGYSSGELTAYRYENGRVVWQDALARTSISTSVSSLSEDRKSTRLNSSR